MEYTKREIQKKIEDLKAIQEINKKKRKEINESVKSISAQINKWELLDLSQHKMF